MQEDEITDGLSRNTEYHYNGLWAVDRVTHPDGNVEYSTGAMLDGRWIARQGALTNWGGVIVECRGVPDSMSYDVLAFAIVV